MLLVSFGANAQTITTVAGNGSGNSTGDGGQATAAQVAGPLGIDFDAAGNYYFVEYNSYRVRKVNMATGIITTVAGNGTYGYSGDDGLATAAQIGQPFDVAVDASGNLFIADYSNQRIRKVDAATGIITTVAGNGTSFGDSGDGGAATAARLNYPAGVAVDGSGNIYISERSGSRIRKVNAATGIITTVAGNGTQGYSGDGGLATAARLNYTWDIRLDASGNLFIVDESNHSIRKVNAATGIITTVAGNGTGGFSGDGGLATAAQLSYPSALTLDGTGNLFIADRSNYRIRRVDAATGIISTVAGNGTYGYSGDGGAATAAQLSTVYGIAVDKNSSNLYIPEYNNNRIRKVIIYSASITETKSISCAGDATGELTATVSGGQEPYTYSWSPSGGSSPVAAGLTTGTYTVTITDALGAIATATYELKVNDTEAPVITKAGSKVISIPAGQSANWNMYTYTFTDPLPAGAKITRIILNYSGKDQGYGGTGQSSRIVVSGTQIGGNQYFGASQNFTIDYTGEVSGYTYQGNNYLRQDFDTYPGWVAYFQGGTMTIHYEMMPDVVGQCAATVTTAPTAIDNCGGTITGTTTDPLSYSSQGTYVITWHFTDGSGNTSTGTQNVIVKDTTPPTITAPANVSVKPDAGKTTASNLTLGDAVTADNCQLGTTTNDAPNTFPLGSTTVTWTVTDAVGNVATATQTVTVVDTEAPVPTIATLPTITEQCAATVTTPTATDNTDGTITGTTTDPVSYADQGTYTVTWTYTDVAGNVSMQEQTVIVADSQAPVVPSIVSKSITIPAGQSSNWNMYNYNFNDPLPAGAKVKGVTLTYSGRDQNAGGTGQWTRMIVSGKNIGGNQYFGYNQNFTINYEGDIPDYVYGGTNFMRMDFDTYPGWTAYFNGGTLVIHYEDNTTHAATLPAVTGECAVTITSIPTAIDNCKGIVTGTTTDPLTYTEQGTYTINWSFDDGNGNISTSTQEVVVKDTQKPTVVTQNITVNLDATGAATITEAQVNNGSSDNCSIKTITLDKTDFTCSNLGTNTVTLTVTDVAGNTSSATAIVTVKDVSAPVAKAKAIAVQLGANGAATITPEMVNDGSSDICGTVTLALSKTTFDCTNLGENTVTLTVTDGSGNEATTTAIVTVEDTTAPIAKAQDITVQLDATGKVTITPAQVNNGSTDNCGVETLSLDVTSFDCANIGANTVTLTVTDKSGNTHTTKAIVTVEDKVAPVVITQNITVQLDAAGNATITADEVNNGSADACGIKSMSLSKTNFDCSTIGANTVTLTVTDNNGNVSTKTAIVTVEDKIAPIALTKNITVKLDAAGKATIVAADVDNGSSDVCGSVTLTIDKAAFDCSNIGENEVMLTVTDAYDNVASEKAVVTVVDELAPVVITQNITVKLDANGTATITTSQIDNGTSDNCGIANMTLDITDFTCENVGQNTVTLTVTDVNGNVAKKEATVTVVDEIAPTAIAKNITATLDANGTVTITATQVNDNSADNCGIETLTLDKDTFGCSNLGANTVTLTVTDKAGNSSTATATVTIVDNIAPTITAPANVVVDVDAGKNTASGVNLGTPVTADNCSVAEVTNDAPDIFPTGTTTVTWTATDVYGNKTTATQTVTVRRDVVAVATPASISVPIRTAYASLQLPAKVTVTYSDGSTEAISVNWAQGNYNGMVAGNYNLTGSLLLAEGTTNTTSLKATIMVTVEPNKVPTALAFSATTFKPDAKADDVIGTLTTTDPDDTEFVYTLVAGSGDSDNSLFEIRGDKVYLKSNNGLSGKTTFTIRVRSTDPYQNKIEKSFTLTKGNYGVAVDKLKIVNAFSPNGDGINDNWTIPELRFYNNVEIEVFDRSGVRLFHTTDPEMAWDGRSSNGQILKGAFFYIVQVKDINLVKKGVVTILKK